MDGFDLAAERKRQGVTQGELAAKVGLNQATVVDIERGRIALTSELATQLLTGIAEIATEKTAVA